MRLPFRKRGETAIDIQDDNFVDTHPEIPDSRIPKKEGAFFRIAIYFGLAVVIAVSLVGYIYIKSYRVSLINRNARSGSVNPVNSNNSDDPFANIAPAGEQKRGTGEVSPIGPPVPAATQGPSAIDKPPVPAAASQDEKPFSAQEKNQVSPIHASWRPGSNPPAVSQSDTAKTPSGNTGPAANREKIVSPAPVPQSPVSKKPEPVQVKTENILDELVLKDDNPFREKFLKKFEESQAAKSQKQGKSKDRGVHNARPVRAFMPGKPGLNLDENELGILPGIAGMKDPAHQLRVYGVIRTGNNSVVLTNRGELRVGSAIDGDAISSIHMNEIYLKSGRTIKVSGQ